MFWTDQDKNRPPSQHSTGPACQGPPSLNPHPPDSAGYGRREKQTTPHGFIIILLCRSVQFILDDTFPSTHSGVTEMNPTQKLPWRGHTVSLCDRAVIGLLLKLFPLNHSWHCTKPCPVARNRLHVTKQFL